MRIWPLLVVFKLLCRLGEIVMLISFCGPKTVTARILLSFTKLKTWIFAKKNHKKLFSKIYKSIPVLAPNNSLLFQKF